MGICLFLTFALLNILGYHQWLTLGDAKWTVQSAQYVTFGGLGKVYSINPQFLPLPGFLLVLAPAVALGNHLHYVNSYPIPLRYPTMWIVVAPLFFVSGSTSILGADYLADTLGVKLTRRRLLSVMIALLVVIPTCCWAGHPEDLLAIGLSTVSIALLLRGRFVGAGMVLSIAIMMQSWALLLIPVLVVATPAARRIRVLVFSCALPATTGILLLALDFNDAFRSLVLQPMQGSGQHLPWWGLAHTMTITQSGLPVAVRVGSSSRSLAVVIAVVAAVVIRRNIRPSTVMFAASVALVARDAFETQVWCYYLAPAAVFLAVAVASETAQSRSRWIVGGLSAFAFYAFATGGYISFGGARGNYELPSSVGLLTLVVTATLALVMAYRRRGLQFDGVDLSGVRSRFGRRRLDGPVADY